MIPGRNIGWSNDSHRHSLASRGVNTKISMTLKFNITDDINLQLPSVLVKNMSNYHRGDFDYLSEREKLNSLYEYILNELMTIVRPDVYYYMKLYDDDTVKALLLMNILYANNLLKDKIRLGIIPCMLFQNTLQLLVSDKNVMIEILNNVGCRYIDYNELDTQLLEVFKNDTIREYPIYPILIPILDSMIFESNKILDIYRRMIVFDNEQGLSLMKEIDDGLDYKTRNEIYMTLQLFIYLMSYQEMDMHTVRRLNTWHTDMCNHYPSKELIDLIKNPFPDNPQTLYDIIKVHRGDLKGIKFNVSLGSNTYNVLDMLALANKKIFNEYRPIAELLPFFTKVSEYEDKVVTDEYMIDLDEKPQSYRYILKTIAGSLHNEMLGYLMEDDRYNGVIPFIAECINAIISGESIVNMDNNGISVQMTSVSNKKEPLTTEILYDDIPLELKVVLWDIFMDIYENIEEILDSKILHSYSSSVLSDIMNRHLNRLDESLKTIDDIPYRDYLRSVLAKLFEMPSMIVDKSELATILLDKYPNSNIIQKLILESYRDMYSIPIYNGTAKQLPLREYVDILDKQIHKYNKEYFLWDKVAKELIELASTVRTGNKRYDEQIDDLAKLIIEKIHNHIINNRDISESQQYGLPITTTALAMIYALRCVKEGKVV